MHYEKNSTSTYVYGRSYHVTRVYVRRESELAGFSISTEDLQEMYTEVKGNRERWLWDVGAGYQ